MDFEPLVQVFKSAVDRPTRPSSRKAEVFSSYEEFIAHEFAASLWWIQVEQFST
jgi:hypothetical protein